MSIQGVCRLVVIAIALVATSCGETRTTATQPTQPTTPPPPPAPPARPTLLAPDADAVIPQNDPTAGCAFDGSRGAGFRIAFDWADVSASAGPARYEIRMQNEDASLPAVNTITETSDYVHLACSTYVVEHFLEGWVWKVRAIDRTGQVGEWAERRLSFAPCRIGRRPCGT